MGEPRVYLLEFVKHRSEEMDSCSECGSPISASVDRCSTCGKDVGAPNVRAASQADEKAALEARFEDAVSRSVARGVGKEIVEFEHAVERSSAVVNCNLSFLREFVSQASTLYANYHRGTQAGIRKAAEDTWDRDRVAVDGLLFGSYSNNIVMAALTLTDTGLSSYGPYSMKLRDVAVSKRSSVLEENSFNFIQHHKLSIRTPTPQGYRANWAGRAKLAVAKLADFVVQGMSEVDFQGLLLQDTGDRAADSFIEVHLFGTFDREAVETVSGPKPKRRGPDIAIWGAVKEQLRVLKKNCHEL